MAKPTKAALNQRAAEVRQRMKKPWDPIEALSGPNGEPMDDMRAIFNDKSPARAVEGTRQGGKSTEAAVELVDNGLSEPRCEGVYVDFDKTHAEKILIADFTRLLDEYDIPAQLIGDELWFDNGSVAYSFSSEEAEIKKLQGLKPKLVIVDEVQDAPDLKAIIKMVRPGLMRRRGRIMCQGLPGRVSGIGTWWDITRGDQADKWTQHRVHMDRNPWLPDDARELQKAAARIELGENSPDYLRHWMGLWPPDDNNALRCVRYFPAINGYDGEPPMFAYHSLGLDPGGTQDPEGVVCVGWGNKTLRGDDDGLIYAVAEDISERREGGDWDNTGARVGPMENRYHPERRFLDYGSAKKSGQIVQYQKDQLITLDAVPDKNPDAEFLRLSILFQAKRLFVKRGSLLEKDLLKTTWDPKSLSVGRPKVSGTYKPTALDALRAAMWGVDGYAAIIPPKLAPTEVEREAEAIEKLTSGRRKKAEHDISTAADQIYGTRRGLDHAIATVNRRGRPTSNPYGLE